MIEKIFKFLLILFSPFGCWGFGIMVVKMFSIIFLKSSEFISFLGGGGLFLLLWLFYFSHRENFWSILEHELTHALFALIFFKRVHRLSASRQKGGDVSIDKGNFIIALAPYFFPLITILCCFIKLLLYPKYFIIFNFIIGFSFVFHLINTFSEFQLKQPDLEQSGKIFSIIFIIFLNIFFVGLILSTISGDFSAVMGYLKGGFNQSVTAVKYVYFHLIETKLLAPLLGYIPFNK